MAIKEVKTDSYTIKKGHLDVGNNHHVWFEQWGNQNAKTPIVMFHGGPGSRYKLSYKQMFDPKVHQVILFDQRGAGNSLPYGELEHNTTQDLLSDTKRILDNLGIEKVYLYGRSWGSTLALLFNIEYPELVKASIIGGVYAASKAETDYIDKGMFKKFYPEVWDRFVASVPQQYQDDPASFHYKRLRGNDPKEVEESARAFEELEGPLLGFDWPGYPSLTVDDDPSMSQSSYDPVPYLIYAHYLDNNCFLPPNYIMDKASAISTPVYIVQGRYDMCCPPVTAYRLNEQLQNSKLYMTLNSHHGNDPENRTVTKALLDQVCI